MIFEYRAALRQAFCHCCDKSINRGDFMVTGYSRRQRGMNMHFHPECLVSMADLIPVEKMASIVFPH